MKREVEYIVPDADCIDVALQWARQMIERGLPGGEVALRLGRKRRTLDQNAKLWPMLQDIAKQVEWQGVHMSREDWKDLFTGSLNKQRPVMGLSVDGEPPGIVMVGGRTSKMNVKQFCELIEFIYSFGSEHGVVWSEKSQESIDYARGKNDKAA